jgi:integrase
MTTFKSIFAERLDAYVRLRRGLGLRFAKQASTLHAFDRYLVERAYDGPLTQELALDFATAKPDASLGHCARRYQAVRHFSDYLATFEPATPRLDPKALRRPPARPAAYIFTEEDLATLLDAARGISSRNPVRGITLHAMVGLAASTGMRVGEVIRLDKADVDLETGVLLVRRTKFAKDRLVPVHATTREVLRHYAAVRDAAFPNCECPAFFINLCRRRYSRHTLSLTFWELARRAGLCGDKGKGPSFHSLRHSFAVRRLVAWYRAGVDVQAMLPGLATYMGHVHYRDTAWYLTATPELLGLASGRYEDARKEDRS